MENKIRIVVCDDLLKIVQYFSDMVNSQPDMEVVGTAQSGAEDVGVVDETKPDIVLMDMQMEYQNAGVDATRTICEKNPGTKVIMITVHGEDDYMFEAYAAGVVDFLVKTEPKEEILKSIRTVYEDSDFVRPTAAKKIMNEFIELHKAKQSFMYVINIITALTPTELDILKMLYAGKNRRQIADERFSALETIKFHIRNILIKTNYKSTKELLNDIRHLRLFDDLKF